MKLYGYWRSSASWRVRIGLALKGVTVEQVAVDLKSGSQKLPEHLARNPLAQVPVLHWNEHGEPRELSQSLAILRWIDRTVEGPSLIPSDPWEEAWTWQLAETINAGIQPLQNLATLRRVSEITGKPSTQWAREFIENGLTALEEMVARRPASYLAGDSPTIADCCLIPQLYNARRFGANLNQLPHLLRVERTCSLLHAFRSAEPNRQPDAPNLSPSNSRDTDNDYPLPPRHQASRLSPLLRPGS